jgi:hypothetical protein
MASPGSPETSGINAIQAAKITDTADFQDISGIGIKTDELVNLGGLKVRPKTISTKFNIATIIGAALIFIVVIAWFEVIRLFLVYVFENKTDILFRNAMANLVYAIIATVIAIFLLFLLMKFWIKSDHKIVT